MSLLVRRKESELLFMQEQVFFGLTTKLQLILLLDIVKAHFVKITFFALSAFFYILFHYCSTSLKKPNNINAVVKKSVLPVFVNSLPKDHYAQRTGQNFQERGINFFFSPRSYEEKMQ